jgi:hypothetical protein
MTMASRTRNSTPRRVINVEPIRKRGSGERKGLGRELGVSTALSDVICSLITSVTGIAVEYLPFILPEYSARTHRQGTLSKADLERRAVRGRSGKNSLIWRIFTCLAWRAGFLTGFLKFPVVLLRAVEGDFSVVLRHNFALPNHHGNSKMTIEELYDTYGHLQGQVSVAINMCAAMAALHPSRETIERIVNFTATSTDSRRSGSSAEQAYAAGMASAIAVIRAALAGIAPAPFPQAH